MDNDDNYEADWGDTDEWDDEDYEEFLSREFPASSQRGGKSGTAVSAIWKWTAWMLLAIIMLFWVWSTAI